MLGLDAWRKATSRLIAVDSHLSIPAAEKRLSTLLQELNDLAFPIEGLAEAVSIPLALNESATDRTHRKFTSSWAT